MLLCGYSGYVVLGERGVFEGFLGCCGGVVEVLEGSIEYFWVGVC